MDKKSRDRSPDRLPLATRFQKGPPKRTLLDKGSPLTREEQRYILYRDSTGGLPKARIARELGVARSTVAEYIRDVGLCPSLVLLLDLFRICKKDVPGQRRARSFFECYFCGTEEPGGEEPAKRHLALDIFGDPAGRPHSVQEAIHFRIFKSRERADAKQDRRLEKVRRSGRGRIVRQKVPNQQMGNPKKRRGFLGLLR